MRPQGSVSSRSTALSQGHFLEGHSSRSSNVGLLLQATCSDQILSDGFRRGRGWSEDTWTEVQVDTGQRTPDQRLLEHLAGDGPAEAVGCVGHGCLQALSAGHTRSRTVWMCAL